MVLHDRHSVMLAFWLANLAPLLIGAVLHVPLERVYDVELEHCHRIESSRGWCDKVEPAAPTATVCLDAARIDLAMLSARAPRMSSGSTQPPECANSHIVLKRKLIPLLT